VASDSPVSHRTVWCSSDSLLWHLNSTVHFAESTDAQIAVAPLVHRTLSGGTPDSPVNYSGAAPGKPEGEEFELVHPGAPDTVRWHTGLSGALDQGNLRFPFCSFLLRPNLFFWLVCVEPLAPVECIILNKLVSPIICVVQFNHQNQLGKRYKSNSLSISPFLVIDANTNQSKYSSA
jgi:hypothetical protein